MGMHSDLAQEGILIPMQYSRRRRRQRIDQYSCTLLVSVSLSFFFFFSSHYSSTIVILVPVDNPLILTCNCVHRSEDNGKEITGSLLSSLAIYRHKYFYFFYHHYHQINSHYHSRSFARLLSATKLITKTRVFLWPLFLSSCVIFSLFAVLSFAAKTYHVRAAPTQLIRTHQPLKKRMNKTLAIVRRRGTGSPGSPSNPD